MVRHHEQGLFRNPQAPEFHCNRGHLEGFARAHDLIQAHVAVLNAAPYAILLMFEQLNQQIAAGQGQMLAVEFAVYCAVVFLIKQISQFGSAFAIFPQPARP